MCITALCMHVLTLQISGLVPATRTLDPASQGLKPIKLWPMFDINLLVCAPFACDEGVVHVINDVTFPEGDYWCFGLRYIFCPHAAADVA